MTGPLRVISHEATRTGAPAVLRALLRYVREHLDVPLDVRLRYGGPLAEELAWLGDGPSDEQPAAVLVNSSLAAATLHELDASVPSAVYVHEEGATLRELPDDAKRALVDRADLVITVSERSRSDLVALGVPSGRVRVVPPVIDTARRPDAALVEAARSIMGGVAGTPLLVGCGEVTWRKGPDLFVALVAQIRRRRPVRACWIGRRFAGEVPLLDLDVARAGLEAEITWLGELEQPLPHLAAADVLVMTSREDPRPMVPMEAASVGTPTAGFAVGGLLDLHERGAAAIAPYPDVVALAEAVTDLIDDRERASELARRCAGSSGAEQGIEVVGPVVVNLLAELLDGMWTRDGS